MVRLIVSDIDGTLIPYGAAAPDPAIFPLLDRLRARGVFFCPASGRQYHSLRGLFGPLADSLYYLCENGAVLYGPGSEENATLLSRTAIPRQAALALSRDIESLAGCRVLISGVSAAYLCSDDPGYLRHMQEEKGFLVRVLTDPAQAPEDIIKVSAYCPGGVEGPARALSPRWEASLRMAVAGPDWLDFGLTDKGLGLRSLCDELGVSPAEVMAFGDNWNDLPMLDLAGESWLMEGADPALAARFPRRCKMVRAVLEELLDRLEKEDPRPKL